MLSKVALSATLAAALVLTPASLAHNVDIEVDTLALPDELVAEDAVAGRDLLLRKTKRKAKKAKKIGKVRPPRIKSINSGDEGDEGACSKAADTCTLRSVF
jgi:hypothetical protein